jgi:hypothetical protein
MGTVVVNVRQAGGVNDGDTVRVYLMRDDEQLFDPVLDQSLGVTSGQAANGSVSLRVAPGNYVVRAFRDVAGDGLPSLRPLPDPQSPGTPVTVDGASTDVEVTIADNPVSPDLVTDFHVGTERSPAWEGACGGFALWAAATVPLQTLTTPLVTRLPSGQVAELDANSPCWSWYGSGYRARFANPGPGHAGRYLLGHRLLATDMIVVMEDSLQDVVDLRPAPYLTHPTAAAAVTTLTPTFQWPTVPGANFYWLSVNRSDQTNLAWASSSLTSTTIPVPLVDGQPFQASVWAAVDDDPGEAISYRAVNRDTPTISFVVATDPSAVVTISGRIIPDDGVHGKVLVNGTGCTSGPAPCGTDHASLMMDDTDVNYSLTVLKASSGGLGQVGATLTTATGQEFWGQRDKLDTTANATGVDISVHKKPVLLQPPNGATGTGVQPTFVWEEYAVTPGPTPAEYSYILVLFPAGSSDAKAAWALPAGATSYDMASPPAVSHDYFSEYDVMSAVDLSRSRYWFWDLGVMRCAYGNGPTWVADCLQQHPDVTWTWSLLDTGLPARTTPVLESPPEGATNVGTRPTFSWQDYRVTEPNPPATFSYVVYVTPQPDDGSCGMWGLPSTSLSLDMASLPSNARDVCSLVGAPARRELVGGQDWAWGVWVAPCDHALEGTAYWACLDQDMHTLSGFLVGEGHFSTAGGGSSSSGGVSSSSGTSSSGGCGIRPPGAPCSSTFECDCGLECIGNVCALPSSSSSTSSTATSGSVWDGGMDGGTVGSDAGFGATDGGAGPSVVTIPDLKALVAARPECQTHTTTCAYNTNPTFLVRLAHVVLTSMVYEDWDNKGPGRDGGSVAQRAFFVGESMSSAANNGVQVVVPWSVDLPRVKDGDTVTLEGILRVNFGNTYIRLVSLTLEAVGSDVVVPAPVAVVDVANNEKGSEWFDGGCKSFNADTSPEGEPWEGALVDVDLGDGGMPVTYAPNAFRFSVGHKIGVTDYFHVMDRFGTPDAGFTMSTDKKVTRLRGFGYYSFGCRKVVPRNMEDLVVEGP